MNNVVWVAYSKEPPFLPIAIADTSTQLAKLVGVTAGCITGTWKNYLAGRYENSRYHKIEIKKGG